MNDLFTSLQQYDKSQDANRPTSGVIKVIDGAYVDVLVRGGSMVLRHVKAVGTATTKGQAVVLTWENGVPTAHITGGMGKPADVAVITQGPAGPAGPQGPQGAQGPQGETGSVEAGAPLEFLELGSTPAAPPAGSLSMYAKTDHKFYKQQSDGAEQELGAGGGTSSATKALLNRSFS